MALNINTNLTNNLDGYLLDAKNVKGTYVVVTNYSDLANLPSACVVEGTLAYCKENVYNGDMTIAIEKGFYIYKSNNWVSYIPKTLVFYSDLLNTNFDITQTYDLFPLRTSFDSGGVTYSTDDAFELLQQYGGIINIRFSSETLSITYNAIRGADVGIEGGGTRVTSIIEYNNKQYIAKIEYDSLSSPALALSFQELQASGGGGGAGSTKTLYHIEVANGNNNNKAIIPIYKEDFDKYLVEMNQVGQAMATAMSITWTTLNTIDDLKTLFDAQKSTQLAYGCDLAMNLLVKYAYESGQNPILVKANLIYSIDMIVNYDLSNNNLGTILSQIYIEGWLSPEWFKNSPSATNETIIIDQNATFTYTAEQIATGGGSSEGSGDGSIYTFRIKINTPPIYVEYSAFDTYADYVGFYVEYNNEYVLVTGDNKESVGIVLNSTMAYTQNTLPNTPYSYLYFDINEVYFNDSNVIKDFNEISEENNLSTIVSLDDLPTYWNSADISSKSFLVNTISSMGNNFKREFGSNDLLEDGFYSVADYTYLESSGNGDSITWHGYTINQNSYFDLSSYANDGIMEYVGKTGGSGGGSSEAGSGSGKLYELNMQLTRYDDLGDAINWQIVNQETLPLSVCIYESNFERFKAKVNPLIDLFNQQVVGANLPTITDINSLVTLVNEIDETVADGDCTDFMILLYLIWNADKTRVLGGSGLQTIVLQDIVGSALSLSCVLNGAYQRWDLAFTNHQGVTDVYYALNVNNSCTLTEYGTSGSGGSGGTATRNIYKFSLKTSTDGNPISTNNYVEMIAKISEDAFNNEFLPELNTLGQAIATAQSQTWTDITNVNDFITLETEAHNVSNLGQLIVSLLVEHSLKDNQVVYSVLEDYNGGDGYNLEMASTITHYALLNNAPINVYGVTSNPTGTPKEWFSNNDYSTYQLCFGTNSVSSFTYTTEQETSSSSGSGSQPVATQQKWYNWLLMTETSGIGNNRLKFRIKEEQFNELLVAVNQVMSQQDPTWTNITDKTGLISLFDTLKTNASDSTTFQLIVTLFGVAKYSIIDNHENVLFYNQDQANIDWFGIYVIDFINEFNAMYVLKIKNYNYQSVSTGIIVNDSTNQDSLLYINSNSTLTITETYE